MGGREGLKERDGKERGENGGREGERNLNPNVPDRSTPLGDTPEPPLVDDSPPVEKEVPCDCSYSHVGLK
jgi:hypothetical protein